MWCSEEHELHGNYSKRNVFLSLNLVLKVLLHDPVASAFTPNCIATWYCCFIVHGNFKTKGCLVLGCLTLVLRMSSNSSMAGNPFHMVGSHSSAMLFVFQHLMRQYCTYSETLNLMITHTNILTVDIFTPMPKARQPSSSRPPDNQQTTQHVA